MSRKPENVFIDSIHRYLPKTLYRMKNHNEFNGGIADVWYDGQRDLWVEYKYLTIPKRASTVISLVDGKNPMLTDLQQGWLRDRHRNGRSVGVIVGCPEGGVWLPGTTWEYPMTAAHFSTSVIQRKDLAAKIVELTSHG